MQPEERGLTIPTFFKQTEHCFSLSEQLSQMTCKLLVILPLQRRQVRVCETVANLMQEEQNIEIMAFMCMIDIEFLIIEESKNKPFIVQEELCIEMPLYEISKKKEKQETNIEIIELGF